MDRKILVVDDDADISRLIGIRLKKQGYNVANVHDGKSAIEWVEKEEPVLVMLDVRLPDVQGTEVLREILKMRPKMHVIMISAHADIEVAVECIKLGAYDFLEKPFEWPPFDAKVKQVFTTIGLEQEVAELKRELGATYRHKKLLGSSGVMRRIFQIMEQASKSTATVFIHGESGTGKELVARAIHFNSEQAQGPFVALNCGAIPENLLESELFGHEKGSFTGAFARKIGKFEQAKGGTIFLDEIGDLSMPLQVKLLRVLQEKEIERVGGTQPIPIDVRVIVATHRDLKKMVSEGKFREDLFYRIHVFPISLPPLRERKEDIPELYMHFVRQFEKDRGRIHTDERVFQQLMAYAWPGNVRELENFVERLILMLGDQNTISEKDLSLLGGFVFEKAQEEAGSNIGMNFSEDRVQVLHKTEKAILEKALSDSNGNIAKASKLAQMSRDTFYRKMKRYAITKPA